MSLDENHLECIIMIFCKWQLKSDTYAIPVYIIYLANLIKENLKKIISKTNYNLITEFLSVTSFSLIDENLMDNLKTATTENFQVKMSGED